MATAMFLRNGGSVEQPKGPCDYEFGESRCKQSHPFINTKWRVCSTQGDPSLWLARSACASASARFPFSNEEYASISQILVENDTFSIKECASISPCSSKIAHFQRRSAPQFQNVSSKAFLSSKVTMSVALRITIRSVPDA